MKKGIHPPYYPRAQVSCACGNIFEVGSTKEHMEVEICSACHPFYTGKEKLVDTAGRVEKYRKKLLGRQESVISRRAKKQQKREKRRKHQ